MSSKKPEEEPMLTLHAPGANISVPVGSQIVIEGKRYIVEGVKSAVGFNGSIEDRVLVCLDDGKKFIHTIAHTKPPTVPHMLGMPEVGDLAQQIAKQMMAQQKKASKAYDKQSYPPPPVGMPYLTFEPDPAALAFAKKEFPVIKPGDPISKSQYMGELPKSEQEDWAGMEVAEVGPSQADTLFSDTIAAAQQVLTKKILSAMGLPKEVLGVEEELEAFDAENAAKFLSGLKNVGPVVSTSPPAKEEPKEEQPVVRDYKRVLDE